jgi:CubicO group peptidase (beta-lactamase class C family)
MFQRLNYKALKEAVLPLTWVLAIALSFTACSNTPTKMKKIPLTTAPRMPAVCAAMQDCVAHHEIAGAVTLVATPDDIIHLDACGQADIAAIKPMETDDIFWIASMTKPLTATAILMLQDEGKLSIDDPVTKYLPELASLKTPDGQPAHITLRHLLTHTSGMPEATQEQYKSARTLADVIPFYAGGTLAFVPGSKWQYCQSGINTLGRIVEVVSGKSYPDFLQQRLLDPLGMKDTGFYLTEAQLPRLAKSYALANDALHEVPVFFLNGASPDYARFCRMLLNHGTLYGCQFLKPETVALMSRIQTGDLKTGFTDGNGWGLGVCVVRQPQGVTAALSPGTFGHGGAYGTQAWIDPVKNRIYVLMVQRSNMPNSDASNVRRAFQEAASQRHH